MTLARTNSTVAPVQLSATKLLALLRHPAGSVATEVASEFKALHRLVESLPLTSAEFCFAHNWLTNAQDHWQTGDANTALYELTMVVRKLKL